MGCLFLEDQSCQISTNCWQTGRGRDGSPAQRRASESNVRPLLPSLDGVNGPPLQQAIDQANLSTATTRNWALCVSPSMSRYWVCARPTTSLRDDMDGDAHRSESTPPRKVMELFTVQPRSLRKSRGLRTRTATLTGDPNPGHCRGAPLEGPDTGDGIATTLSVH